MSHTEPEVFTIRPTDLKEAAAWAAEFAAAEAAAYAEMRPEATAAKAMWMWIRDEAFRRGYFTSEGVCVDERTPRERLAELVEAYGS